MSAPKEIADGIFHWTAIHPEIRARVHSYYLHPERVLLDPLLPDPVGLAWFDKDRQPEHVILTNRLHSRHTAKFVARFGCSVWVNAAGLSHLAPELKAKGFKAGDILPGKIRAFEIGVLCPDESALVIPRAKAVATADGVIRRDKGPLGFVPDNLLVDEGTDPDPIKRGLKAAYARLAEENWQHLLMAHGTPWVEGGREALRAWAAS